MRRFGDYVLLERLGQGSGGTVHLARPIDGVGDMRLVVVKVLHHDLLERSSFVQRFQHEALIAVSVDNEHVVKVYDVGRVADAPYIAMEYVEGKRLIDVLRRTATADNYVPLPILSSIVAGGLSGLAAVHEAVHPDTHEPLGAVHRDISPSNLILSYDGYLKLIDLGLGKSNVQDWQTRTGAVLGSLGYMAPEQVLGGRVDHRADVYALSAVFYELLALEPYIPRGDRLEMLRHMEAPAVRPPSARRPDVPPAIDELVTHGLAHDPLKRIESAARMRRQLISIIPPAPPALVAKFLYDLVGAEQAAATSKINDLLAQPIELGGSESKQPTVVFARRHSTIRTLDDVEPSFDDVDQTALVRAERESSSLTRRSTRKGPPSSRPKIDRRETRRDGIPIGIVAVLLIVAVAATVLIDRTIMRIMPTPAPVVAPPPLPTERAPARAIQRDVPEPIVEAPRPVELVAPPALPPTRARTRRASPVVETKPEPPIRTPAQTVDAEVRRLTQRSEKLRRRHPERGSDLDEVLTDISVWSASRNYEKALRALSKIDRRLDQIAAQ